MHLAQHCNQQLECYVVSSPNQSRAHPSQASLLNLSANLVRPVSPRGQEQAAVRLVPQLPALLALALALATRTSCVKSAEGMAFSSLFLALQNEHAC